MYRHKNHEDEAIRKEHLFQNPEDITDRLLNVFHDTSSSNYSFEEDFVTRQDILENEKYFSTITAERLQWKKPLNNTEDGDMNYSQTYDFCTEKIVNSSIAIACGPYFDQDIMHAIEICYQGN